MHRKAITHLKKSDPVMATVIEAVGKCTYAPDNDVPAFEALISSIIYQQLSGRAAATIERRFQDYFGGRMPTPKKLLAAPDEDLRGVGISRQKLGYLRDLATKFSDRSLPVKRLPDLADDEIIQILTQVKGVGRWTVQMFLMFRLGRPDVLPDLDLGIQKAIKLAYRLDAMPTPKRVLEIGEPWRPYRTVASWYLWRSLE